MTDTIDDIRSVFKTKFGLRKNDDDTIEIIGASFICDDDHILAPPNEKYIEAEIEWYKKQSLNVNELGKIYGMIPELWVQTANDRGQINSNYGHLVFSIENGRQYTHVLNKLVENPDTRQASIIYNRPSMHLDSTEHGKNDFVCTNSVTYYIRDFHVHAVVQMRSNDAVFGYNNDYAWQKHVLEMLTQDLNIELKGLIYKPGLIHWQVQNLHVYPRHFSFIEELINNG